MFSAFRSDDEDVDTKSKSKTKPIAKPKAKTTTKPLKSTRTEKPKPVSKPNATRAPFKKKEVIEPSDVDNSRKSYTRRGRGIKPGDTDSRGKRFFDKKSGTGRDRGVKKGGGGKSNWGKTGEYNTNFSISGEGVQVPAEETTPKATKETEEEDEVPPEPEVPTYTLEEFKKKKAEKRVGKAFEDLSEAKVEEIKEGKAYTKKDKSKSESEDVFLKAKDDAERKKGKKQSSNRTKKAVEGIGFTVKNQDRERRSFRGRGRGGMRGRGRGGYKNRSNYSNSRRVNVDTNDFPQLGA